MHAPIRPIRGRWPSGLERRLARFFWADPSVIADEDVTPDQFREAMSAINVGGTIKITGANRHPDADTLLIQNVDLTEAAIVDMGASDGSTSVELISRLSGFRTYTIADLYLTASAIRTRGHLFLYDPNGTCILVVGRRMIAWPSTSKPVRLLYRPLIAAAQRQCGERRAVQLLNSEARALMARDKRVTCRVHDVFTVWSAPKPDVIKVANLLRRLYFSDERILEGLRALHESLARDGYLLIVDNPRIPGIAARGGVYRKAEGGFVTIAESGNEPEIADLIARIGSDSP